MTATVEDAIWLKPHVGDATKVRHHRDVVNASVASAAELLRQRLGSKRLRVEDVEILFFSGFTHLRLMLLSWAMAGFATHPCNQVFELQFVFYSRICAMTAEAIPGFVTVDVTAYGFLKSRRRVQGVSDRPVQSVNRAVVADPRLVQFSVVSEHVSLRDAC